MEINLSDETLDHLRYHLGAQADALAAKLAKAQALKTARVAGTIGRSRVTALQARLAEVRDLQAIFEPVDTPLPGDARAGVLARNQPPLTLPPQDFVVTQDGSVFHFDVQTADALAYVKARVSLEAWQWLGGSAFAVDHRLAPDLCYQLREDGWAVVVR